MADHPSPCARQAEIGRLRTGNSGRERWSDEPRFAKRTVSRGQDDSFAVDCGGSRCVHSVRPLHPRLRRSRNNFVLGRMGKGYSAGIAFDLNSPMGDSTCISCGECMVSCPTGALTNKSVVGTAITTGPDAQGFEAEDLLQIPVFKGVSGTFLELNRGAIVKRRFRKGEIICKEGEFGSTAFFILEGKAQVSISTPIAHVKTQGGGQGFFKRLTSTLAARDDRQTRRGSARPHDSDRRVGGLELRKSGGGVRTGRSVRRNDVHEFLSAVGNGAGGDGRGGVRDAAQRAGHHDEEQNVPRADRSELPAAGAGKSFAWRADVRGPFAGLHRAFERERGAAAIRAGTDRSRGKAIRRTVFIWCASGS